MKKLFLSCILLLVSVMGLQLSVSAEEPTTYEKVIFLDKDGQHKSLTKDQYRAVKRLNKTFADEYSYSHLQVLENYYSKAQYRNAITKAKESNTNKFSYLVNNYKKEDISPIGWTIDAKTGEITGTVEPEVKGFKVVSIQ